MMREESNDESEEAEGIQAFSETVGMVPNLNKNDNVIQGIVVGVGTLLTALVFYLVTGDTSAFGLGAVFGLVFFGLLSGLVLMVIGWMRTFKK